MPRKKKEVVEQTIEEVITIEETIEEREITEQERLEAMRLYVQSMEKVSGHTNEQVRGIIHSIHKRIILALNYSGADDAIVKALKTELNKVVEEEKERYKDD